MSSGLVRGVLTGVAGTAAMTAWQEQSAKLMTSGEEDSGGDTPQTDEERWEQAPAPAKVARKLLRAVGQDPPADQIELLTNVMHWGYGTGWGVVFGLTQGARSKPLKRGLVFGSFVWAMSYVQLVPMGLYEPPWKYSPSELAIDLSYHLAYGAGLGAGDALLPSAG